MDEFWVCQNCKSLNRAGTTRCYHCREKMGSQPKPQSTLKSAPPSPAPAVSLGSTPPQPSFYSRPAAAGPALGPAAAATAAGASRSRLPHPIAALRRRVAGALAARQSVSVAPLGYFTAAVLALLIAVYVVAILAVMPAASYLLQHADPTGAWNGLSGGQQRTLVVALASVAIVALTTLVAFAVFVGLSTHNAPGLGARPPLLTPYRAGTCWGAVVRAQLLIAIGLLTPIAIIWQGYAIPGLIVGLVAVEVAHRRLDEPMGWLIRPARHLPDLYTKLGTDGSASSILGSIWSFFFWLANLAAMIVAALPAIGLAVFSIQVGTGRTVVTWQSSGLGPAQALVAAIAGGLVLCTIVSAALLIPLTIGLVRRQKTRRMLVRVGRSRSWVARPGEGGNAPAATAPTPQYDPYVDENRLVERHPGFPSGPLGGPLGPAYGFGDRESAAEPGREEGAFPWSEAPRDEPE